MEELFLFGKDIFNNPIQQSGNIMQRRYIFPPFSVLDTRQGNWMERKKAWINAGIKSEIGRNDRMGKGSGKTLFKGTSGALSEGSSEEIKNKFRSAGLSVSIFDPVLCELMYEWFCPKKGMILDPFAGGSVRGIIAALSGRRYWGCDLSKEQITANKEQAEELCPNNSPKWVWGDSLVEIPKVGFKADFVFSCPPYADLEVYSKDPRDLSTMEYPDFLDAYTKIIRNCYTNLKENRFACFVVGEARGKNGCYYGFVADTIKAFQQCGFHFYNEMILVNPSGSLCVRAGRVFNVSRKIGKMHQNVLIFVKGDAKKAVEIINKRRK